MTDTSQLFTVDSCFSSDLEATEELASVSSIHDMNIGADIFTYE